MKNGWNKTLNLRELDDLKASAGIFKVKCKQVVCKFEIQIFYSILILQKYKLTISTGPKFDIPM